MPEDNGKQNPNEFYTNKYKKHVVCSYGYKFVSVDGTFSKPFKFYLDENVVFMLIQESKYCSDVMKRNFNKDILMTKKDNEGFKKSTRCWICDNEYADGDVKVRDHCSITGKYRGSAHRN